MKTTRVLAFIAIGALAGEVPAEEPLNNASVSGTVTAATIHSAKIVDSVAGTPLTAGTTIEVGKITKGELVKGKASGGDLPKEVSLVRGSDNVMFKNLAGLSVIGAELKDVSAEGVSIGGNTVDLTGKKLHLTDATLKEVNIDSATVPRADVDKPKSASGTTAQSAPAATETANIPLTGDYFVFKTDVMKFRSSDDTKVEVTAPKGSCFRINQEITLPDAVDNSKTQTYERGVFVTGKFPRFVLPPYVCPKPTDLLAEPYRIHANLTYEVPKEQIFTERDRLRYGWTYGVLVAPFKYYPKAQNFSAGASVGPYLGYRVRDRQGDSQVLAVSIGATNASVTTKNTDGTTSSSTETGFSTAAAYVVEIKDAFNIGFLAGADFFSKSKNIPNEGKLWLGLSFGLRLH